MKTKNKKQGKPNFKKSRDEAIDAGDKFFINNAGGIQSIFQVGQYKNGWLSEATVYFRGDRSVGIEPYYYTVQLPDISDLTPDDRDKIREKLEDLYNDLDGETRCQVFFTGELF